MANKKKQEKEDLTVTQKEKRYLKLRKASLTELKDLVYKRTLLNKDIRDLRREMDAWDRALITN